MIYLYHPIDHMDRIGGCPHQNRKNVFHFSDYTYRLDYYILGILFIIANRSTDVSILTRIN